MINLKIPLNRNKKFIEKFFMSLGFDELVKEANKKDKSNNQLKSSTIIKPDLNDLYNLYQFVLLNKRTTILEFGTGWSSLIFVSALNQLKKKYFYQSKNLRRKNLFTLFIVDNEKKYLNISKERIKKFLKKNKINNIKVNYIFSDVYMINYKGYFATEYKKLPVCNPDFIYLDGPGQFNLKKRCNNFTTAHYDLMPMSCDILKMEFFLIPGSIIVVDGRASNANFLKLQFKRKWLYFKSKKLDQHVFILKDESFGKFNDNLIKFYNKKK